MESVYQVTARRNAGGRLSPPRRSLRAITFLAPNLLRFYEFLCRHLARKLHYPIELSVGTDYAQLEQADMAFVCGLPYVEFTRRGEPRIEPLLAPVLQGERYGGKPIYFSDVIVRRDSPFRCFADLRGCSWAYNEPHSQSGYGITCFHLARRGETAGYFGSVVEAGWHEKAIRMVCRGNVDASAIDSHVLSIAMRRRPSLGSRLRVIEALGPSPIQPIVVARQLSEKLKEDMRHILLRLADDPQGKTKLRQALVDRFEEVTDATYGPIRRMLAAVEASFLSLGRRIARPVPG